MNNAQQDNLTSDVAVIKESLRNIEKKIDDICEGVSKHADKINNLEKETGVLGTKISLFAIFLSALSIIAAAIAGWISKTI